MVGKTLSHYNIEAELGRGGMGVVYKAVDTKLDRTVAIKLLPSAALGSDDDRARFYREAKAAAQLHHPHIASVFEIDEAVPKGANSDDIRPFIVMEYVAGETLHDRIEKGPLKLGEAVRIAGQIASGLEAAHEKGIVHRDIKSGNVMLTEKGEAKILDFGLAQTAASTKLTRMGSTLGTVAFMSPEQARGEAVDGRSDLWSLGVILYGMITGGSPFPGDYEQAIVYSILNGEVEPLTALRTGVPMELERITNKCLAKSADNRYQSAADLMVDLRNVDLSLSQISSKITAPISAERDVSLESAPQPQIGKPLASRGFSWPILATVFLAGIIVTVAAFVFTEPAVQVRTLNRVEISFPGLTIVRFPHMSPTGEYLGVSGVDPSGNRGVFLRDMRTGDIRFIPGSESFLGRELKFSPNGERLAFTSRFNGGIFVAVVPSGIPRRITDFGRIAFWESDDAIIMTDDKSDGGESFRVFLDGSSPEVLETKNPQIKEGYGNILKTNIPGTGISYGHQLVRVSGGGVTGNPDVFTLNTSSGELTMLETNAINPEYVSGGFLTYQLQHDDGHLLVRPVDTAAGLFTGPPRDVLPANETVSWGQYAITFAGDLLYSPRIGEVSRNWSLWDVDLQTRDIRQLRTILPVSTGPTDVALSAKGDKVIYLAGDGSGSGNIFIHDLVQDSQFQFTFDGSYGSPTFSPDGRDIFFVTSDDIGPKVYRGPVDSSAEPELIIEGAYGSAQSPDGRLLAVTGIPPRYSFDIVLVDLETGNETILDSLESTPGIADFSPDGQYLVYQSDFNVGSEIIVHSVHGNQRIVVPGISGHTPRWSPDGDYLYYGTGARIRRIPIRLSPSFGVLGPSETVAAVPSLWSFDISDDGTRMIVASEGVQFVDQGEAVPVLIWLQNWSDHLKREFE